MNENENLKPEEHGMKQVVFGIAIIAIGKVVIMKIR